jgi:hypothetical protein
VKSELRIAACDPIITLDDATSTFGLKLPSRIPGGTMSTALVLSLRESCGYLKDARYHQTAQLMATAADEIERLNRQLASTAEEQPAASARGSLRRALGARAGRRMRQLPGSIPRELGT